jgi:hypothetical protein
MSIRAALAIAGLVLAVGATGCGPAGTPEPRSSAVLALPDLVAQVAAARYADYAGRPGVTVRDEAAFEEMRDYLLSRYRTAEAAGTITVADAVFDCLRQPASAGPDAPAGCPAGHVPVRRVTLDDLVRFRTLADFLGKGPGPEQLPPS